MIGMAIQLGLSIVSATGGIPDAFFLLLENDNAILLEDEALIELE